MRLLATIIPTIVSAQQVDLHISSCNYLQYVFYLKQGVTNDTVAVGRFDAGGKASFVLPDRYMSFRGVGNLSVTCRSLSANIIINSEDKVIVKKDDISDKLVVLSVEN